MFELTASVGSDDTLTVFFDPGCTSVSGLPADHRAVAGLGHLTMARVLSALEHTPPFKAAMAIQPLKSVFLSRIVAAAKG